MSFNQIMTLDGEIKAAEARISELNNILYDVRKATQDHANKTHDEMDDLLRLERNSFEERRELYDAVTDLVAEREQLLHNVQQHDSQPDGFLPANLPTHFDTTPPDDFFKRDPGDEGPEWWQAV